MDLPSGSIFEELEQSHQAKKAEKGITASAITMCILGAAFYCYEYYLRVAPSVMSAELKETFMLGEAGFGHLAACYYYAYTPMQIPVGIMMDRFGPRKILTLACFFCAIGTYLFAATSIVVIAQIGRFLVGFGSAFAYVGVLKISSVWLPQKYFALMAGICTALGMLGATTGAVTISYLVEHMDWQTTLYYSALIGIVLTLILWLVIRDGANVNQNVIQQFSGSNDNIRTKFSSLKGMALSSQMWISGLIGCLTFLPISGFAEVWAISFLKVVGMSKHDAAVGSSMIFLGFALGGPIWGLVSDALQSRRKPLIIGSFVSAILMAFVIFTPTASLYWMYPLLFFSAFFASAQILVFAISNDFSRAEVSATAVAFTNMVVMIGGALIPPIIGKFLDNVVGLGNSLPISSVQDYSIALAVLPISLLLSGILSIILKESYQGYR